MSNIRDPVRDEIKEYYETHKISIKKLAEHFNISENTIKSWKNRDKKNGNDWVQLVDVEGATEGAVADNKKKQIHKAKAMVIAGSTLKEASNQTELSESLLKKYSSKDKWINQQERFMQKVYSTLQEKHGDDYIRHREQALEMLCKLGLKAYLSLCKGELEKENAVIINMVTDIVLKTVKGQSELLGIPEMKMYIRQDKDDKKENKTSITNIRNKYGL